MKNYVVYAVYPDGKKFFCFEHEDRFECECYVNNHWYDYNNRYCKLVIEKQ